MSPVLHVNKRICHVQIPRSSSKNIYLTVQEDAIREEVRDDELAGGCLIAPPKERQPLETRPKEAGAQISVLYIHGVASERYVADTIMMVLPTEPSQ